MDMLKAFEGVREFHVAFDHPVGEVGTNVPISDYDLERRTRWTGDEVQEFVDAETLHDQADALIDTTYFLLGSLVVAGAPIEPALDVILSDAFNPRRVIGPRPYTLEERVSIAETLNELLSEIGKARGDYYEQIININSMLYVIKALFVPMGIDPEPIFWIVQDANMAKLQPDGSVARHPDGKIKKPDGWVAPETLIQAEVERQIAFKIAA